MSRYKILGLLVLVTMSAISLILCPHSKVEESFNVQATHDIFYHGFSPALSSMIGNRDEPLPYDHIQFPGVVPRTFAGPFIIAYILRFISFALSPVFSLPSHPLTVQVIARSLLLAFILHAHYRLGGAAERKFGSRRGGQRPLLGTYFLIITASQFHIPFYCSRMLPNIFALGLIVHAYADWFDGMPRAAASWIVLAAAIFRCDALILLFTVGLTMLLRREITVIEAIVTGIKSGLMSLALTLPLDCIMWGRFLWPEGEVLFYNTVENKSSEWGTSPWHWYASSALPKAMLLTAVLLPFAFIRIPEMLTLLEVGKQERNELRGNGWRAHIFDSRLVPYLSPVVAFVALYSFLPHKEMRFIFPALPMLNVVAAYGSERLHNAAFPVKKYGKGKESKKKTSSSSCLLLFIGSIAVILITLVGSTIFLSVSRHNYPGGDALAILQGYLKEYAPSPNNDHAIRVHIDVASAMTGVSLFGQRAASLSRVEGGQPWVFSKAGYEKENEVEPAAQFTHFLSEKEEHVGYRVVGVSQGYPRFNFRRFQVTTEDAIFIHEHINWRK
mmetsp:Transcript_51229/g.153907  ORF Transcript_51229/g.153907 Transcript_51229/m.153907 type:complete len:557 (-) Transcript_51229:367-2037(-)